MNLNIDCFSQSKNFNEDSDLYKASQSIQRINDPMNYFELFKSAPLIGNALMNFTLLTKIELAAIPLIGLGLA